MCSMQKNGYQGSEQLLSCGFSIVNSLQCQNIWQNKERFDNQRIKKLSTGLLISFL